MMSNQPSNPAVSRVPPAGGESARVRSKAMTGATTLAEYRAQRRRSPRPPKDWSNRPAVERYAQRLMARFGGMRSVEPDPGRPGYWRITWFGNLEE